MGMRINGCVQTGLARLLIKNSPLIGVKKYTGMTKFQLAMGRYGVKFVGADNGARDILNQADLVEKFHKYAQPGGLPLSENLYRTFGGHGIKVLVDKNAKRCIFLGDRNNVKQFEKKEKPKKNIRPAVRPLNDSEINFINKRLEQKLSSNSRFQTHR